MLLYWSWFTFVLFQPSSVLVRSWAGGRRPSRSEQRKQDTSTGYSCTKRHKNSNSCAREMTKCSSRPYDQDLPVRSTSWLWTSQDCKTGDVIITGGVAKNNWANQDAGGVCHHFLCIWRTNQDSGLWIYECVICWVWCSPIVTCRWLYV